MQTCLTCRADSREDIDKQLLAGIPVRDIAKRHGLSPASVWRHSRSHLPEALLQSRHDEEVLHADNLLDTAQHLLDRALALLDDAEEGGDKRAALSALREARACVESLGKLTGNIQTAAQVNVTSVAGVSAQRQVIQDVADWRRYVESVAVKQAGPNPVKTIAAVEVSSNGDVRES